MATGYLASAVLTGLDQAGMLTNPAGIDRRRRASSGTLSDEAGQGPLRLRPEEDTWFLPQRDGSD